jgi:hypothetical protein
VAKSELQLHKFTDIHRIILMNRKQHIHSFDGSNGELIEPFTKSRPCLGATECLNRSIK